MNKYLIYRLIGDEEESTEEELVAVEYGLNYQDAVQSIVDAINADLSELPESAGCEVMCEQVDDGDGDDMMVFLGIIVPPSAPKNTIMHYSVKVEQE